MPKRSHNSTGYTPGKFKHGASGVGGAPDRLSKGKVRMRRMGNRRRSSNVRSLYGKTVMETSAGLFLGIATARPPGRDRSSKPESVAVTIAAGRK